MVVPAISAVLFFFNDKQFASLLSVSVIQLVVSRIKRYAAGFNDFHHIHIFREMIGYKEFASKAFCLPFGIVEVFDFLF